MKISIIDNSSFDFASILSRSIEQSKDIRIAVAFASRRGIAMIQDSIDFCLLGGAFLEFLIGLDLRTTEPEALKSLYKLSRSNNNVALYCYASLQPSSIYHPKLYLLNNGQNVRCIIGSSNLTEGGLKRNIEVNFSIEANINNEIISDSYTTYNRLKFHPKRVIPDEEFIDYYSSLCIVEKEQKNKHSKDKHVHHLLKNFEDKAKSLQHPKPSDKDLVGRLRLVFEHLPEKEFTTNKVYENEEEFSLIYPENRNIKAKIRQQLQILRDMGLIKHIGKSRWVKTDIL